MEVEWGKGGPKVRPRVIRRVGFPSVPICSDLFQNYVLHLRNRWGERDRGASDRNDWRRPEWSPIGRPWNETQPELALFERSDLSVEAVLGVTHSKS